MMNKRKQKYKECYSGFTLLFTLLVINIALVISVGVASLLLEEIKLSGTARDSQLAFYAADSGVECAMYLDYNQDLMAVGGDVQCSGSDPDPIVVAPDSSFLSFEITLENGSCSSVTIEKGEVETHTTSRGYNVACDSDSPRKTERGLEVF